MLVYLSIIALLKLGLCLSIRMRVKQQPRVRGAVREKATVIPPACTFQEGLGIGRFAILQRLRDLNMRFRLTVLCLLLATAAAAADSWYPNVFRKVHLDYHENPWIQGVAEAVTPDEARRQMKMMKDSGVEAIEFFSYDHFGATFYPSDVLPAHPNLKNDYFGNMAKAAHEQGIKVIAYVNVFGSVYLRGKHPDWYVVDKNGDHPAAAWLPEKFSWIDATSPFLQQIYKPLLKELITRYRPDAIWLDGGSWLIENHSYSDYSKAWYRKVEGAEIPDRPKTGDSPEAWQRWNRYRAWQRNFILTYLKDVTSFVHEIDPKILVADNSVGRFDRGIPVMENGKLVRWAHPKETGVDFLTCDPVPFAGNHSVVLSREARYQSALGIPFDYHTERFQGWGEWTLRETTDFKMECSTTIANGGRCFIADQPWPDGTLEPAVYERVKETYDYIRPREGPYRRARAVSDIALLAADTTNVLAGDLRLQAPATNRTDPVGGAFLTLVQEGFPFQMYGEANLQDALKSSKLIVVPEQAFLLDSTIEALRAWVEAGGRMLISGETGRYDWDGTERAQARVERLLGVKLKGSRRAPVNYYQLTAEARKRAGVPDMPMMVRGNVYEFSAENATLLAEVREARDDPWDENGKWRHYEVTGAMPPKKTTSGPGAVLFPVGNGQVLYVAGNWFTTYGIEGNPSVRKMLASFVTALLPEGERRMVVKKPLAVEATLLRNESGYIVSLVNSAVQKQPSQYTQAEELPPVEGVEITLRVPEKVKAIRPVGEGGTVRFKQAGGAVRFAAPRFTISSVMQVEAQ